MTILFKLFNNNLSVCIAPYVILFSNLGIEESALIIKIL